MCTRCTNGNPTPHSNWANTIPLSNAHANHNPKTKQQPKMRTCIRDVYALLIRSQSGICDDKQWRSHHQACTHAKNVALARVCLCLGQQPTAVREHWYMNIIMLLAALYFCVYSSHTAAVDASAAATAAWHITFHRVCARWIVSMCGYIACACVSR